MSDRVASPTRRKETKQSRLKLEAKANNTPRAVLRFGLQELTEPSAGATDVYINPFASPNENGKVVELMSRAQGEETEGWTFQWRRRHTPKLASPRPEAPHPPPHSPAPRSGKPLWEARGVSHIRRSTPPSSPH